jgi:hypothetical protein
MVILGTIALFAISLPGSYDCAIERQVVITETGASGEGVNFPDDQRDAWRFAVRIPRGDASSVTVEWPANPVQIAGTHRSLPLAPGQIAFVTTSAGPCMFTEQACVVIVELSARDDGHLAFSILPAGSVRDDATNVRSLLHVVFLGSCQRQSGSERR